MRVRQSDVITPKTVKIVAAIVIGLSIGTLVPPEPVSVPALGEMSGVVVGGLGLVVGGALYTVVPDRLPSDGCGCTGECGCS